jgi:hypothetical protein
MQKAISAVAVAAALGLAMLSFGEWTSAASMSKDESQKLLAKSHKPEHLPRHRHRHQNHQTRTL